MAYPPAVARLHRALAGLPGVAAVQSAVVALEGVDAVALRAPDYAALPHGALRRTGGGLAGEALIQFEFALEPTRQGWRTLELLAWFVRDQARGGEALQLRPFALPPSRGSGDGGGDGVVVQLGDTLRWQVDLFCSDASDDLGPELARVDAIAAALELSARLYGPLLVAGTNA